MKGYISIKPKHNYISYIKIDHKECLFAPVDNRLWKILASSMENACYIKIELNNKVKGTHVQGPEDIEVLIKSTKWYKVLGSIPWKPSQ